MMRFWVARGGVVEGTPVYTSRMDIRAMPPEVAVIPRMNNLTIGVKSKFPRVPRK